MLSSHVKFNVITVSFIFREVKYDLTEYLYKTFHVNYLFFFSCST